MNSREDLRRILQRIDGRGYRTYGEIAGRYDFGSFRLSIDHVQGDPFAAPSRLRAVVPAAAARFPTGLLDRKIRRLALQDYLIRRFDDAVGEAARGRGGSGRSGEIRIDCGGQEVIERTAMRAGDHGVEARFTVGLPAAGRTVLGRRAAEILLEEIPAIVSRSLLYAALNGGDLRRWVEAIEDQEALRGQLEPLGLVAFVADGALLPRRSGIDDRPLAAAASPVAWESPPQLRRTLEVPNAGRVAGTAIPSGVTLVVGGGFHGKSTFLQALERGVYNHVPGDGRERVVTTPAAMKIRAEDGRRVEAVNIDPFISNLPLGRDTVRFRTDDASGSTSQAASIVEAIEAGARLLLIDEDTSATNFMIRDGRMQRLVEKSGEPITPFVDRVGPLHREHGVSTILVMGGSGDYFDVADRVIRMEAYRPAEVTAAARDIAAGLPTARASEAGGRFGEPEARRPRAGSFDPSRGRRAVKIDARGRKTLLFGRTEIDLGAVEQIVDPSQTRAIGAAIHWLAENEFRGGATLRGAIDRLADRLERDGLDLLEPRRVGNLAMPRRLDLAAAVNRLRTLQVS